MKQDIDPVVITGIGGRFPESSNIEEFWSNLLSGQELCTNDDRRWPIGFLDLPLKAGKIPDIEKFDSQFFGMNDIQANNMDPQFKICHETTFEAVIDAGMDPIELYGPRTGMFSGYCYSDSRTAQKEDASQYKSQWNEDFSEVSKYFGFKGFCMVYDSACASSFSAFNEAFKLIQSNVIDTAIVSGVTISTSPYAASSFCYLGMINIDGESRCMDRKANGYARSETICTIVLQKRSVAKRIYAVVVNTKTNSDGYKKEGITFPGYDSMVRLMKETYEEVNLDPKDTKYVEAHVTGTHAGDPIECNAIETVFCPADRSNAVLLGCLKSNMGHAEGASGVAAITKACLIIQKGMIPPNIHYSHPNPNIAGLLNQKLKPVLEVTPFNDSIISVNSFGFGGSNIHTIIKCSDSDMNIETDVITGYNGINRIILFKGRTEASFKRLERKICEYPNEMTIEYLAMLNVIARLNRKWNLLIRGYFIVDNERKIVESKWKHCDTKSDRKLYFKINSGTIPEYAKTVIALLKSVDINVEKYNGSAKFSKGVELIQGNDCVMKIADYKTMNEVLSLIGNLYMNGYDDIRIENLYPKVVYPVSRSTSSTSPLISWNHDKDWIVYKVPEYFKLRYKNKRFHFDYSGPSRYLSNHKIDGRILFPATAYLWSIWQSLAMANIANTSLAYLTSGIQFWNVTLTRPIVVSEGDEICFVTSINPDTGSFEILQNGICLVYGCAMLTDADVSSCPDILEKNISDTSSITGVIGKKDFYKELRIRGYDHEDLFQGVESCNIDGSGGIVSFLRNWICFADAVFHLLAMNDETRSLYLPTGFEYLQVDAKVFKNISVSDHELYRNMIESSAIENDESIKVSNNVSEEKHIPDGATNDNENSKAKHRIIPKFRVILNKDTKEIFTNGMYVKKVNIAPIPRKKVAPLVRSYHFCPLNETAMEIDFGKEQYINECLAVFRNEGSESDNNNNDKILNESENNIENDGKEAKSLLDVIRKIRNGKESFEEEINEYRKILSNDMIVQFPIESDPICHQFDIVYEANYGKEITITEMNLSSKSDIKQSVERLFEETSCQVTYQMMNDIKSIKDIEKRYVESNLIIIQHSSLGFTFLKSDLNAEYFEIVNSAFKRLSNGNFIMIIARERSTLIEKEICNNNSALCDRNDIIMNLKSIGAIMISVKKIGQYFSILARKNDRKYVHNDKRMIKVESFNYDWIDELKSKMFNGQSSDMNALESTDKNPIWIISENENIPALSGLINCIKNEDKRIRGIIFLDNIGSTEDKNHVLKECLEMNLILIVYKNGSLGTLTHSRSILDSKIKGKNIGHIKTNDDFCLNIDTKGDFSSLAYHKIKIPDNGLTCKVKYSSLNFRDVMIASGRIHMSAYPASLIPMNSGELGNEFSGIDSNGNRIMGIISTDAIATKVNIGSFSNFVFNIPDWMTYEEAATIPIAYSTAFYALIMRAKLVEGESVLIHAGSGGVGQAAINICLSYGCNIYTTVGSKEKREFIKETYPKIKDDHIFDSRSDSFGNDILIATDGRGVDLILNSLSEKKLQTGLTCLAANGRFLEIGKYDMMVNSSFDE